MEDGHILARRRSIWISDELWKELSDQADVHKIPTSAYVREAAVGRLLYERGLSGDRDVKRAMAMAKKYLERQTPPESRN